MQFAPVRDRTHALKTKPQKQKKKKPNDKKKHHKLQKRRWDLLWIPIYSSKLSYLL